jgi:hypothetical protein
LGVAPAVIPPDKNTVLNAIRKIVKTLGRPPSRCEFVKASGITEYHVLKYFSGWRDAVTAAGFEPHTANLKIEPEVLLKDWAEIVRRNRRIPTQGQYRREGAYSIDVFEKNFGPWSNIPQEFCEFANGKPEWLDVVALLPSPFESQKTDTVSSTSDSVQTSLPLGHRHTKRNDRPTYGDPIDFRGLRHAPVNEDGVVFLFGMVARELGYLVEAVQAGFPDCEAKRQIDPGRWQRVRIEFEFESRNFRDHGHSPDGCDAIVCWRHNWPDCPPHLEIIELVSVLKNL